ncbi:hypothetical protein PPN31114_04826 [Pandoraea pneumonica]|uniref:Uncharacterized protein n=1 Tax=Pandoraea pneumonica TaxID=2508299 RepID=A0A5E4YXB5_9BURK|nr:hypothetical protein [Pandoraea pneumonica]VVE53047.1 hypothetical protein PPN31114_04826 [Pandoraea pneumonica]
MLPINAHRVDTPRLRAESTFAGSSSQDADSTPADNFPMDTHDASAGDGGSHVEANRVDAELTRNTALSRIAPISGVDPNPQARTGSIAGAPDEALDAALQAGAQDANCLQFHALRESIRQLPLADAQRLFGRLAGRLAAYPLSLHHWGPAFERLALLGFDLRNRLTDAILALLAAPHSDQHGHAFFLATESVEATMDATFLGRVGAMECDTPSPALALSWTSTLESLRRTSEYCEPWRLTCLARAIPTLPEAHRSTAALATLTAVLAAESSEITEGWSDLTSVLINATPERERAHVARELLRSVVTSRPSEAMDVLRTLATAIRQFPDDHAGAIVATLTNLAAMRLEYEQLQIFTKAQSLDGLQAVRDATELDHERQYPRPDFDALLSDTLEALAESVYGA